MKKVLFCTVIAVFCLLALPAFAQVDLVNENFDSVTTPDLPTGWSVENTNGDSYTWVSDDGSYVCSGNSVVVHWNGSEAMNDWLFTPQLAMDATHSYTLTFNYRAASTSFPEDLTVYIGTSATSGAQTTELVAIPNITNTTCQTSTTSFTVPATGTSYFIGFHGHSAADMFYLIVDDIVVTDESVPVELQSFSIE